METYYYLYRITNRINGKIYVGVHKTDNLDDGYMGSGLLIRRAIEKYGIENFEKTILQYFNSAEEAFETESQIVNEEFVADESTYNLKEGGHGSWDFLNRTGLNQKNHNYPNIGALGGSATSKRMSNDSKFNEEFRANAKRNHPKVVAALKNKYSDGEWTFSGKHHTEETKFKIASANSKHQSGSGNSQYGKMWIYNEDLKECKRIPKGDQIPEGWKRGRKMKF